MLHFVFWAIYANGQYITQNQWKTIKNIDSPTLLNNESKNLPNSYSKRSVFWKPTIFAPSKRHHLGHAENDIKPMINCQKHTSEATRRCTLHFHKFDYGRVCGRHFCKYRCLKMTTCNASKSSKMCSAPSAIIKIVKRELETQRCFNNTFLPISHRFCNVFWLPQMTHFGSFKIDQIHKTLRPATNGERILLSWTPTFG